MLTGDDLQSIQNIVKDEVEPLKKQLNKVQENVSTIEMKIELVNKRVSQAQEETIETLSDLIDAGYNLHEERIKKIEDQLNPSQTQ